MHVYFRNDLSVCLLEHLHYKQRIRHLSNQVNRKEEELLPIHLSPVTPVPRQSQKYISSVKNKTNLSAFLVGAWCEIGREELQEDQTLVKAGGFGDNEKLVLLGTGEAIEIAALYSDQEEADTRLKTRCI